MQTRRQAVRRRGRVIETFREVDRERAEREGPDVYEGHSIAVVVPAYNEEGLVGDVIDGIPEYVDTTFVVDDHSTDGTWEEIAAHVEATDKAAAPPDPGSEGSVMSTDGSGTGARGAFADENSSRADGGKGTAGASDAKSVLERDVVPVKNPENNGRGSAVKNGYRLALVAGHDVVVVMDGDGQMDPEVLTDLLDPIVDGEADYAKGNRLVSAEHCEDMSNWRLFGNILLTALTKVASGQYHLRDPQNGYTAISAEAVSEISLDELYDGYGFLNDLLIQLAERNFEVVDVPMEAVYDDEESGIRYKTFVPNLSMLLLQGFVRRLWSRYATTTRGRAEAADDAD